MKPNTQHVQTRKICWPCLVISTVQHIFHSQLSEHFSHPTTLGPYLFLVGYCTTTISSQISKGGACYHSPNARKPRGQPRLWPGSAFNAGGNSGDQEILDKNYSRYCSCVDFHMFYYYCFYLVLIIRVDFTSVFFLCCRSYQWTMVEVRGSVFTLTLKAPLDRRGS